MTWNECVERKGASTVLSAFFKYLEQIGLKYCVVGRTDELPGKITSDIDIVIDDDSMMVFYHHLLEFSRRNSLKLVQVLQHEQSGYYYVLAWKDSDGKPKFLHPDVCGNYYRNGRLFLTADNILSSRIPAIDEMGKEKGFFVADASKEFIYYLVKKIDKQKLDEEHGNHLSSVWRKATDKCNKEIERFWSNEKSKLLRQAAGEGDWVEVRKILPALQKSLHSQLPSNPIKSWIREFIRLALRILFPTGLHIVFLGPDGSGKSSIIDRIVPDLAPAFRKTAYFHLRPGLGIKKNDGKPVVDPHGQHPRSVIASVSKVIYFGFDYVVGWWLTVWPKSVRSTLVVFDRYYHDMLVDPKRYRYGGPMWLARCVGKLIPKPDIWILLDAPPEVLQERKQEVPFEETARQRMEYLKLVKSMENGIVIDASQGLDDVVGDVNTAILNFMAERTEKHLAQ